MRGKNQEELTTFYILQVASEWLWCSWNQQVKRELRNKDLILVVLLEVAYEKVLGETYTRGKWLYLRLQMFSNSGVIFILEKLLMSGDEDAVPSVQPE